MDAATLIPLAIEIAITGVISALFLWGADVLLKYDAGFPALLFASVVAAGVDQIPYFGSYLQWLFFLGIVYKFGRLMIIDALWLAVIAFVMKMLLLLVVMSYLGKKMGAPRLGRMPLLLGHLLGSDLLRGIQHLLHHQHIGVDHFGIPEKPEVQAFLLAHFFPQVRHHHQKQ